MRGHEEIAKVRLSTRRKPAAVFINDYPSGAGYLKDWKDPLPQICIHCDMIETLDLRVIVGCIVSANGATEERAKALFNRCMQFKPYWLTVIGPGGIGTLDSPGGWIGVYREEEGIIYA